jgi:hypothetical protein
MAIDWAKSFFTGGVAVVRKLKLGTAVDSDIAIIITTVPAIIIAFVITFWPILLLILIPLYLYHNHYEYWRKNKPEYLRSEKHEETMLKIRNGEMGDKSNTHDGDFDQKEKIPNPEPKKIKGSA